MARGFSVALDDCLAAIERGESLEACLDRHPDHADELRTHLLLSRALSATPRHEPRPAAQSAAYQRFRARAEDIRLGRGPRFSININLVWLRPVAVASVLIVFLLAAGGGVVYASQDTLPDSPLYRVKLVSEDVRLWFVFDDVREADILLDQSSDRTDEIMEMLRNGDSIPGNVLSDLQSRTSRAVRILEDEPEELALLGRAREQSAQQEALLLNLWGDVSESAQDDYAEAVATLHNARLRTAGAPGSVAPDDLAAGVISITGSAQPAADEGSWLLGGVEVQLDSRTLGDTDLTDGEAVRAIAARGADGRLLALDVTITDRRQPEQGYVVSGALEDVLDDEVVIAGQRIAITETTLLKLKLLRGQQVEIGVEDVGGQAVASIIEAPSREGDETASPLLAYEGIIEEEISIGAGPTDWVVSGQTFLVTPDTELDAGTGVLAGGARARVEAIEEGGVLVAKRVTVLATDREDEPVRVEGVLQGGDSETWIVSGVEVAAPPDADIPDVGSLVTLEGSRQRDTLIGNSLIATSSPEVRGFVLLRGQIGEIEEDGTWRVGLARAIVDDRTVVLGGAKEGNRVFIWAGRDERGELHALYATVLDRSRSGQSDSPSSN